MKRSRGSVAIVFPILLLAVAGYFLVSQGYLKLDRLLPVAKFTPAPVVTPDPTADWKTYRNGKYGFEIKYPTGFFFSTQPGGPDFLFKISDSQIFEKQETATVIEFRIDKSNLKNYAENIFDSEESNTVGKIGIKDLKDKFGPGVKGDFLGNPPWGYYYVFIPLLNMPSTGIVVITQIHDSDELSSPQDNPNEKDSRVNLSRQILSTFTFTNHKITEGEALEIVNKMPEIKRLMAKNHNASVGVEGFESKTNSWSIRVYEMFDTHRATYAWYYVNAETGKVTKD